MSCTARRVASSCACSRNGSATDQAPAHGPAAGAGRPAAPCRSASPAAGSCRRRSSRARLTRLSLQELRLVLAPLEAAPRHGLDLRLDDEHGADPFTDCLREQGSSLASRASSTETGRGGSCFTPGDWGRTRTCRSRQARTRSRPRGRQTGRRSRRARSACRRCARRSAHGPVRPHAHGLVLTSTWSRVRNLRSGAAWWRRCVRTSSPAAPSSTREASRSGVDQLGMDEAAGAEVHAVLLLALAPQRRADVADPHRLGDLRPQASSSLARKAASPPPARPRRGRARRSTPAGPAPLQRRLDEIGGVGRRQHRGLGGGLDRQQQALGVPRADRNVAEADALERGRPRLQRTGPRCTSRRCAGPRRRPTPRSSAPSP